MGVPEELLILAKSRNMDPCSKPGDHHDIMSELPTEKANGSMIVDEEKVISVMD